MATRPDLGKTVARGYGQRHRNLRTKWRRTIDQGGVSCWRCSLPIPPGTDFDLGHDDDDRSAPHRGPEHIRCNRGQPSRARAGVKARPRPLWAYTEFYNSDGVLIPRDYDPPACDVSRPW